LFGFLSQEVIECPYCVNFAVFFQIELDQFLQNRLHDIGISMLKTNADNRAVFRHFRDESFPHRWAGFESVLFNGSQYFFRADYVGHLLGKVQAGQNL
jgi:hypothetical protein